MVGRAVGQPLVLVRVRAVGCARGHVGEVSGVEELPAEPDDAGDEDDAEQVDEEPDDLAISGNQWQSVAIGDAEQVDEEPDDLRWRGAAQMTRVKTTRR